MEKCFFTGLKVYDYWPELSNKQDRFGYMIIVKDKKIKFRFCECINSSDKQKEFITTNKDIIYSLLLHGKELPTSIEHNEEYEYTHKADLEIFLTENYYPKTPAEKFENLFLELYKETTYDGEELKIVDNELRWRKYFFKNAKEFKFYLQTLHSDGLIEGDFESPHFIAVKQTFKGLNKYVKLQEEGDNSNRCFIAMSFGKEEEYIFDDGIKPVCDDLGFNAIRVDKIQPELAMQTINDLIVAEIKKSKFIIADLTKHKNGAYFEAGYALGRGKKVIYTCHKDDFDDTHFDVNHFPILIYENVEDLKTMLKSKIEAYIMD